MNSAAFQKARADMGLRTVRVHDLRHTFGLQLRGAGVNEEDRALLLGHAIEGMPRHYATTSDTRLVEAANKVLRTPGPGDAAAGRQRLKGRFEIRSRNSRAERIDGLEIRISKPLI